MATWILLRGLMHETRHWGEFPAAMCAQFPEDEVVSLDLPGNGRLNRSSSPLGIEQMAEHCRAELGARGMAPPYHLLGLSMGAMVAVAWGSLHPQEVRACVLINTSLRNFDPLHRRMRPSAYPGVLKLFVGGAVAQESAILRLVSCRGDAQPAILDAWVAYRRECPVSLRNALRQLVAAGLYRAPALGPAMPVLVLVSEKDGLVNPCCSRHIAARWGSSLAIHPTAGHDLPLDDASWVARQIRDWLAKRLPSGD